MKTPQRCTAKLQRNSGSLNYIHFTVNVAITAKLQATLSYDSKLVHFGGIAGSFRLLFGRTLTNRQVTAQKCTPSDYFTL